MKKINKIILLTILLNAISINASSLEADLEEQVELLGDLGYFYGYSFGNMLKEGKSADANIDRLIQGLKDSVANLPPNLSEQQREVIYNEVRRRQALAQAEMEENQVAQAAAVEALAASNLEAGEAYLAENAKRTEVMSTASGLQYEILEDTAGPNASANSTVVVNYRGTFINGEVFDQSGGTPVEFGLQQVISGWTEGLQLMSSGDKFRLHLHPNLAYGAGSVGQIPPNSVLVFDIELVEIK